VGEREKRRKGCAFQDKRQTKKTRGGEKHSRKAQLSHAAKKEKRVGRGEGILLPRRKKRASPREDHNVKGSGPYVPSRRKRKDRASFYLREGEEKD